MYSIVDLEATGGKFNEESIIEIAIYKYDGSNVVDQFISLVNPHKDITPYVEKLTGISAKMVDTAPLFSQVAKRIIEITDNSILVAHNAQFDYRLLQIQLFLIFRYLYHQGTLFLAMAFIAGFILLIIGLFRAGIVVNFISPSVITGFVSAAAITISTGQLKKLFGIHSGFLV